MINFKNILVTTDFSENAAAAIPAALELARQFGGTIHLLHVFEDDLWHLSTMSDQASATDMMAWLDQVGEARKARLRAMAWDLALSRHVHVEPVMLRGDAAQRIVQHAADSHAGCIVIATHGRTGLSRLVLGSVADKVVRLSPCPVLTIQPSAIVANQTESHPTAEAASAKGKIASNEEVCHV